MSVEKVMCRICGHESEKTLQAHINHKHNLNNKGYYSLYPDAPIYSRPYMDFHHKKVMDRDPCYKKKLSENTKRLFKDKEWVEKHNKALKIAQNTPEAIINHKNGAIGYFKKRTEKEIEDHKNRAKLSWENSSIRSKRKIAIKFACNTIESKQKRSISLKKYLSDPLNLNNRREILKKTWAKPENRKKLEEIIKIGLKAAMSPEGRENYRKANLKPEVKKKRSEAAKRRMIKIFLNGKQVSSLNVFLKNKMNLIGLNPIGEYPIGPYLVDFCFPENKLVIEADGDWWHANPEFQKERGRTELYPVQKKMVIIDKAKNTFLKNHGWKLLRFWERDIYKKTSECLDTITASLSKG